jgi:MFS family permease
VMVGLAWIFKGPALGPVIGAFVAALAGWWWTMRVVFILSVAMLPFAVLLPESHGPTLLARRSKRLRSETGRGNIWASHEIDAKPTRVIVSVAIGRPLSQSIELAGEFKVSLLRLYIGRATFPRADRSHGRGIPVACV